MNKNYASTIILVILSACLFFFVYFGFTTNYTAQCFSPKAFDKVYQHDIFRYRVLGPWLVHKVMNILPGTIEINPKNRIYAYLDTDTLLVYKSMFFVNLSAFCLTVWVLSRMMYLPIMSGSSVEKQHTLLLLVFAICITQYVIVPYDTLSYLFITGIAYCILTRKRSKVNVCMMILCTILGMLTRESMLLGVSFMAAIYFLGLLRGRPTLISFKKLAGISCLALSIYLGLRLYFGFQILTNEALTHFFTLNIASVLFGLLMIILLLHRSTHEQKVLSILFILCSAPYLISVYAGGILAESRLWIPLILIIGIISRTNTNLLFFENPGSISTDSTNLHNDQITFPDYQSA
jgi:hypothetical protein